MFMNSFVINLSKWCTLNDEAIKSYDDWYVDKMKIFETYWWSILDLSLLLSNKQYTLLQKWYKPTEQGMWEFIISYNNESNTITVCDFLSQLPIFIITEISNHTDGLVLFSTIYFFEKNIEEALQCEWQLDMSKFSYRITDFFFFLGDLFNNENITQKTIALCEWLKVNWNKSLFDILKL